MCEWPIVVVLARLFVCLSQASREALIIIMIIFILTHTRKSNYIDMKTYVNWNIWHD